MNKETKEKGIKELHETVLERLFIWRNDKNLLNKIYSCKDNEIRGEIKNFVERKIFPWERAKFSDDVIDKYIKKLSKSKKMQKEIKEGIIKVILGTDEEFKENECVRSYIEGGKFDDEIKELLQQNGKRLAITPYSLLRMDSFKEIYNTEIKQQSSSSMTIEDYRRKLREERKYYILFEDSFRERFEFLEKEYLVNNNKCLKTKLKEFRNLTVKSKILAKGYRKTSMLCFGLAFAWFSLCCLAPIFFDLLEYICDWQYELPRDYSEEIFIFLSNLLFKLPSFVLCLVGVKFLYLFVQYKTEEREFSMLDSYLEKLPQYCTKERAELVKQLAPHFFPDKKPNKISQGFLQDLLLKIVDKDKH